MRPEFRSLRISQLERALAPFLAAKNTARPRKGWIRAVREITGITIRELAEKLHKSASVAANLERSEAEYRITLASLRRAADALGCELVYALVPKSGKVQELAEGRARNTAAESVRAVEHSMALEDQAVGGIEEKIKQETQRLLKRRGKK